MQRVSSTERGSDQKTLMMIYRSLVRCKIDYGCIVYKSKRGKELANIESVSNEAKKISSGCFKSTPAPSLQVITIKPPLQIRRDMLSLSKMLTTKFRFQIHLHRKKNNKKNYVHLKILPLRSQSESKKYTKLNLENKRVLPDLSYSRLETNKPSEDFHVPE